MNSFKGIIFAGCSFTWGQGLHYYSDTESLKYPQKDDSFHIHQMTNFHLKYMESKRFARLVADNLKTVEFVNDRNGGNDKQTIQYWATTIGNHIHLPYSDFSHLVFQLTEPIRSHFDFELDGIEYSFIPSDLQIGGKNFDEFKKWLETNGFNFKNWYQLHIVQILELLKQKLIFFEEKGIETSIMTWPEEYLDYIKKDVFLSERLISFQYKFINFESLESLMTIPEMKISTDKKNLKQKVYDDHPSLSCHQIIAESIIKKLTKNDKTKLHSI